MRPFSFTVLTPVIVYVIGTRHGGISFMLWTQFKIDIVYEWTDLKTTIILVVHLLTRFQFSKHQ